MEKQRMDRLVSTQDVSASWQDRVEAWAKDRNILDGSTPGHQLKKLIEEIGELASAIALGDLAGIKDGVGDSAVVLTIIAKQIDSSLSECQEIAWNEIKDRKGRLIDGKFVKEANLRESIKA
jgi:NTP pyrophosphatase (non-canonical NTP hydrolase)